MGYYKGNNERSKRRVFPGITNTFNPKQERVAVHSNPFFRFYYRYCCI